MQRDVLNWSRYKKRPYGLFNQMVSPSERGLHVFVNVMRKILGTMRRKEADQVAALRHDLQRLL